MKSKTKNILIGSCVSAALIFGSAQSHATPSAVDAWVAQLQAYQSSDNPQPLVSQVSVAVAALQSLEGGGSVILSGDAVGPGNANLVEKIWGRSFANTLPTVEGQYYSWDTALSEFILTAAPGAIPTLAGDVTGAITNNTVKKIQNNAVVSGVPAKDDQYYSWDSASQTFYLADEPVPGRAFNNVFFGNGQDGNATITTAVLLTRDMYYNNLTIGAGGALNENGFRVFVSSLLDLTACPYNGITIQGITLGVRNKNGTAGSAIGTGGTGGGGISVATTGGMQGAGGGGASAFTAGAQGTAGTNAASDLPSASGASGAGGLGAGGIGGVLRAKLTGAYSISFMASLTIDPSVHVNNTFSFIPGGPGGNGGGGGGGNGTVVGGGGGGGGASGGNVLVFAQQIARGAGTAPGCINADGGNAGAGGTPTTGTNNGGGGGGSGGGGGWLYVVYHLLQGTPVTGLLSAQGGNGGAGGNGTGTGVGGNGGDSGAAGRIDLYTLRRGGYNSLNPSTTTVAGSVAIGNTGGTGGIATAQAMDL